MAAVTTTSLEPPVVLPSDLALPPTQPIDISELVAAKPATP
ncbi:hypothetical protein [Microbacterium rhizomatis]|nr:hypothetical protein [Microbacterium rhizomatis]